MTSVHKWDKTLLIPKYQHYYNNAVHARNFTQEVKSFLVANPYYQSLLLPLLEINYDAMPSNINNNLFTQLMRKLDKHFKLALETMKKNPTSPSVLLAVAYKLPEPT